jgi:hypothetical protein
MAERCLAPESAHPHNRFLPRSFQDFFRNGRLLSSPEI